MFYWDYSLQNYVYTDVSTPIQFKELVDTVTDNAEVDVSSRDSTSASTDGKYLVTVSYAGEVPNLVKIDTQTGDRSIVGEIPSANFSRTTMYNSTWVALQAEGSGQATQFSLYEVDIINGSAKTVPLSNSSMFVSSVSSIVTGGDKLYITTNSEIYSVDPASGVVVPVVIASINDPASIADSRAVQYDPDGQSLLVVTGDYRLIEVPLSNPSARKVLIDYNQFSGINYNYYYGGIALTRVGDTILLVTAEWIAQYDPQSQRAVWLYFAPYNCGEC